ncbi:hypothetical protein Pint_04650 [Pistacia integerrima]|uniref:Uncharacterized protein n=1 Tax=Pistacia integerrima TaxID=434235 RepID=A0ACC0Z9L8_9ROSI|nr:hypothetical protein Pint_04650 [Pistacia integerrima]
MATEKLHVAKFPWFAFGHFIPYLHLSNKIAERGHRVSYLLPKGALPKLQQLNLHPDLIHFLRFPMLMVSLQVEDLLRRLPWKRIQLPPGYPSTTVIIKPNEAPHIVGLSDPLEGASLYERLTRSLKGSDAIALRSCQETEGPYSDYLGQQYSKPVLLTGPILPETSATKLEEKWGKWLNKFEPALTPPHGCSPIEEALPEGLKERIGERGLGAWRMGTADVDTKTPFYWVFFMGTRLMVEELKVAIEVEIGVDGIIGKEALSKAIKLVMDNNSELGASVKKNHVQWKNIFSAKDWQDEKLDTFVRDLQFILESAKASSQLNE